jgi:integrase
MPDMPRPRPPHLHKTHNRHGTLVWYVQKKRGAPKIRIREEYGTPAFDGAYEAAMRDAPLAKKPEIKASKGTLEWAWLLYRQSGAWQNNISEVTRRQRENIMKHVLKSAGSEPLSAIDEAAISEGIDRRAKTPSQAKNFKQTMNQFFIWLKKQSIVSSNPVAGAELPRRPQTGGFKEWTEDDIVKYETKWRRGTRQRVMLDVYMYTGLRRGDAAAVGKEHVYDMPYIERDPETGEMVQKTKKVIGLKTEKSQNQTAVHLPLLPALAETLAAGPTGDTFIINAMGGKYVKESLGNAFKETCIDAGILDKSAHGLRKAAATRAADNGATAHELMAIFGWKDIKEAEIYTRAADRKRLAMRAMDMVNRGVASGRDTSKT